MTDFYVDSGAVGANNGLTPADAWTSVAGITGLTDVGDHIWLRRSHVEIVAFYTLNISTFLETVVFSGWPLNTVYEAELFAARPAAGISAGWDSDVETHATVNGDGSGQGVFGLQNTRMVIVNRLSIQHGATASANYVLRFVNTCQSPIVMNCILDNTPSLRNGNELVSIGATNMYPVLINNTYKVSGAGSPSMLKSGTGPIHAFIYGGTLEVVNTAIEVYITDGSNNWQYTIIGLEHIDNGGPIPQLSQSTSNLSGLLCLDCIFPIGYVFGNATDSQNGTGHYVVNSGDELDFTALVYPGILDAIVPPLPSPAGGAKVLRYELRNSVNRYYAKLGQLVSPPFNPNVMNGGNALAPFTNSMALQVSAGASSISFWGMCQNAVDPALASIAATAIYKKGGVNVFVTAVLNFAANDIWGELSIPIDPDVDGLVNYSLVPIGYEGAGVFNLIDPTAVVA